MKKYLLLILLAVFSYASFAQAPKGFNYQTVIRNNSGESLTNQAVRLRIGLIRANIGGTLSYQETHLGTTNPFGLLNIVIGNGADKIGLLDTIKWSSANYFIKIEVDITGGSIFSHMGTAQLQSVPYALYAESSKDNYWQVNNNNIYNVNSGNVGIGTAEPNSKLEVKGTSSLPNDTLFQVKDSNDNPVFIVMPDGVHVIVPENGSRATVGGFAVSGRSTNKGPTNEYMIITPDSARIYIKENNTKAVVGGFAVSGRSTNKNNEEELLRVTTDSINVSKSMYIPRLTTLERDNLGFIPSEALIVFNTTDECMQIYKNGVWSNIWCFHCAANIITQPHDAIVCSGQDTSFFISATGTNINYQWQLSTDNGGTWNNLSNGGINPSYSGVNSWVLNLTNIPVNYNGYKYRCQTVASCPPLVNSTEVFLNVGSYPLAINSHPTDLQLTTSCTANFSVSAPGHGLSYQWQQSVDGINFVNINNGGTMPQYLGCNSPNLSLSNVPLSFQNYKYRCIIGNNCDTDVISNSANLSINSSILITLQPSDQHAWLGQNVSYNLAVAGSGMNYQWQVSTDGGSSWVNLSNGGTAPLYSGVSTENLMLENIPLSCNAYKYRCIVSHFCIPSVVSNEVILTISVCSSVTDVDGNVYPVVGIGNQCWMKENLRTTKFKNNVALTEIVADANWNSASTEAYCEHPAANTSEDGFLYNWYAVQNTNGLCPTGWHVPSESDWSTLIDYLGGPSIAGGKMKEINLTHWNSPNTGATNESNFTALASGLRDYNGTFGYYGILNSLWSATSYNSGNAYEYRLFNNNATIMKTWEPKTEGYSVRCIRD